MFRKITSNRDPQATVAGELQKEFAPFFNKAGQKVRKVATRYPRLLLALMIISILVSGVFAFTVMREQKNVSTPVNHFPVNTQSGIGQIANQALALQKMWALQSQINDLMAKDTLNDADSILFKHALENIEAIKLQLKAGHSKSP